MTADEVGHADETLSFARGLLDRSDVATRGLWPRAAALLGRQALEDAISWIWLVQAPGLEDCSMRAQMLCLSEYLGNEQVAEEAAHIYARLSWACHHHPYELAPTAIELRAWLEEVSKIIAEARLVAASRSA